jgi:high-affinity Fe2+/Pb2+ permease
MSNSISDVEQAEKLSRRRASMLFGITVLFLAQQAAYFSQPPAERAVDYVRIGAWMLLAATLLAALLTGGFWLKPRAVRALMDDDVTQANRASALKLGFALSMATAIALYVLAIPLGLSAREVIHVIVSTGLVAGLLRFGLLERRVHKLG